MYQYLMPQSLMAQLIYHGFYDFATGSEEKMCVPFYPGA